MPRMNRRIRMQELFEDATMAGLHCPIYIAPFTAPPLMKILEYIGLDTSRVKTAYRKVTEAIARDDFHAAQVKKLSNLTHGKFYRAKLDGADRLLFSLVRHDNEVCALML